MLKKIISGAVLASASVASAGAHAGELDRRASEIFAYCDDIVPTGAETAAILKFNGDTFKKVIDGAGSNRASIAYAAALAYGYRNFTGKSNDEYVVVEGQISEVKVNAQGACRADFDGWMSAGREVLNTHRY